MDEFLRTIKFLWPVVLMLISACGMQTTPAQLNATPPAVSISTPTTQPSATPPDLEVIASDLQIPWEIVFLPDGDMLITERIGQLIRMESPSGERIVHVVEGVQPVGEGGLLGLALHPDFENNALIYLYLTTRSTSGLVNQVVQYRLQDDRLSNRTVILDGILASSNHDGGRMVFGPDGMLYITTGDAEQPDLAQDTRSLNGKILRINPDGSIPPDNPFGNAVFSYGHRNPQGLAWDAAGRLWSTEHGPSGLQSGFDELNLIIKGVNYGWPLIRGEQTRASMQVPVIQSGASDTWAPAGLAYLDDMLYFTGLRGTALYRVEIVGDSVSDFSIFFKGEYGRLRAVTIGPDGWLYLSTSNTDGMGSPFQGDDRIIRVNPNFLE